MFAACQTPLGMQSGSLNDTSLSASSMKGSSHKAANARPFRAVGWCAKVMSFILSLLYTSPRI